MGTHGSVHNDARTLFFAFKDQRQSLTRKVALGKEVLCEAYHIHLTASVDAIRYLIRKGMAFRGHDKTKDSLNRGNFLELLDLLREQNPNVRKVVMENAPGNNQLTCPHIQKQFFSACASETVKVIIGDIGDKFFSFLIDEARDSSIKEKMDIVLRYLDNHEAVVEWFLGVVHVVDTTALSLKSGIDEFFAKHGLSISKLRRQGYDGASNMRGELNGLKTLIFKENPSARLQNGEISIGRGLNQESSVARSGATRWGSHYITIVCLLSSWSTTIQLLGNIFDDGFDVNTRGIVGGMMEKMENYEFVFVAHLMMLVLGIANILSQFLQQKDQNILEAVSLLQSTKKKVQDVRENGWDALLQDVDIFYAKSDIIIPNMEDNVPGRILCRRIGHPITYYYHFRVEIFCQVIDQFSQEMGSRFNESNTELFTCIACFDPKNLFSNFNESKLLRLENYIHKTFHSVIRWSLKTN